MLKKISIIIIIVLACIFGMNEWAEYETFRPGREYMEALEKSQQRQRVLRQVNGTWTTDDEIIWQLRQFNK